jgi:hypothetical protein
MSLEFFKEDKLQLIKSLESPPKIIEEFLTKDEVRDLINFEINATERFVNREDGRKTGLGKNGTIAKKIEDWDPRIREILKDKIERELGSFSIADDEYPPHFFRTVFPVSLHADTGRDPNCVIYKQILLPLEIVPNGSAKTIIFDRSWYGQAANFIDKNTSTSEVMNHHVIRDNNGNFIQFNDIASFYNEIKNDVGKQIKKNGGVFNITPNFVEKIKSLIGKERYNIMTNEHITNNESFDEEAYRKYLSHIPYEYLTSLKIKKIFDWQPGSAFIWNRTEIHASNNYMKDGVKEKLGLAIFTIKK